jgi:hypothetical protein
MKKLILIGTAITLFAFSSSAFAQPYDPKLSCDEWCIIRCQNAGQYARTGCVFQCPANCNLARYEWRKKNCPNGGECPKGSCSLSGASYACKNVKNCSPNNCAGGARQGAKG